MHVLCEMSGWRQDELGERDRRRRESTEERRDLLQIHDERPELLSGSGGAYRECATGWLLGLDDARECNFCSRAPILAL